MSNDKAKKSCAAMNSILLTDTYTDAELIQQMTIYRDTDGIKRHASIWLIANVNSIGGNPECGLLKSNSSDVYETDIANCDDLFPFVCVKSSIVLCKNNCFHQGQCIGTKCLCHPGWEAEDCSKFHCNDVNNCNGKGTCVGPNQCQCNDGFSGRACSSSHCPRYSNCNLCVKKQGCGWCDTYNQCLPGTGYQSDLANCPAWFYYKCVTTELSSTCSSQINQISCSKFCNETRSDFSKRSCQDCENFVSCFDRNKTCNTWVEEFCPSGIVATNYDDLSRTNSAVFNDNVYVVDAAETTMFYCPYKLSTEVSDNRNLFITVSNVDFEEGHIVISAQSEGIMHKIDHIIALDGLTYVTGSRAGLSDIIETADFRATVPLEDLMHILTQEQKIDLNLFHRFMQSDAKNISEPVFLLENSLPIMKCAGHVYESSEAVLGYSHYVVLPKSSFPEGLTLGSLIFANKTNGYLETVLDVLHTSVGTYALTNLTHCTPDSIQTLEIDTSLIPSMSCYGGNGWPGLLHFNSTLSEELLIGKTIIGRGAEAIFAKIIEIAETKNFVFLEVVNVEDINNGTVVLMADPSHFVRNHRRSKRTLSSVLETISRSVSLDVCIRYMFILFLLKIKCSAKLSLPFVLLYFHFSAI